MHDHAVDMPLGRFGVDRDAQRRLEPDLIEQLLDAETTRVVAVSALGVAVDDASPHLALLHPSQCRHLGSMWSYLGTAAGVDYVCLELPDDAELPGRAWFDVRDIGAQLSDAETGLAVTALSLARWHRTHRFCPACGQPTVPSDAGWASHCAGCGATHYPRTDPAVIMAITDRADRLLLGRGAAWRNTRRYSVLAGYVETGESLEAAVRREVAEEVGVEVGEVSYVGNQPWPPSGSLMVAFDGEALDTELTIDRVELDDAAWFSRAELSRAERSGRIELPPPAAIAHTLIEAWRRRGE